MHSSPLPFAYKNTPGTVRIGIYLYFWVLIPERHEVYPSKPANTRKHYMFSS